MPIPVGYISVRTGVHVCVCVCVCGGGGGGGGSSAILAFDSSLAYADQEELILNEVSSNM